MKRDTDFGGSADLCGSRCCPLHVCAGNADGGPESCTALFFTYAYLMAPEGVKFFNQMLALELNEC